MPHPDHFEPLPPVGAVVYGAIPLSDPIMFFPQLFYHGLRVLPMRWNFEKKDPVLYVEATPMTMNELTSPYFMNLRRQVDAKYPSEVMLADGWARIDQAGYGREFHVDDLEKIEGDPPDGPF